jgi:hypothetical protein
MDEFLIKLTIVGILVLGQAVLWSWVGLQAQQKISQWPFKMDWALTSDELYKKPSSSSSSTSSQPGAAEPAQPAEPEQTTATTTTESEQSTSS